MYNVYCFIAHRRRGFDSRLLYEFALQPAAKMFFIWLLDVHFVIHANEILMYILRYLCRSNIQFYRYELFLLFMSNKHKLLL